MAKLFICGLVFAKRANILPVVLKAIRRQTWLASSDDWELHILDTTNVSTPELYPFSSLPVVVRDIFGDDDRVSIHEYCTAKHLVPSGTPGGDDGVVDPVRSAMMADARNQLRELFLATDCTHLCMFDDDTEWPDFALETLLADDRPMVSGVQLSMFNSNGAKVPAAVALVKNNTPSDNEFRLLSVAEVLPPALMDDILLIGWYCCVIRRDILERVVIDYPPGETKSDDYPFCKAVIASGATISLDTRVKCYHHRYTGKRRGSKAVDFRNYLSRTHPLYNRIPGSRTIVAEDALPAKVFISGLVYAKRAGILPTVLRAIRDQTFAAWELHIMDTTNASTPSLYPFEQLSSIIKDVFGNDPRVHVHEYSTAKGFSPGGRPEGEGGGRDPQRWAMMSDARNQLRELFLKTECTHLCMFDDDTEWPLDAVQTLLSHDVPLVSGVELSLFPTKKGSFVPGPVARRFLPGAPGALAPISLAEVMRPCVMTDIGLVGWYCFLIRRDILEQVTIEYRLGKSGSEDLHFCRAVRKAGYPILLDTRVKCRHHRYPAGSLQDRMANFASYALKKS